MAPDRLEILGTKVPYVPVVVREYRTITPEEFERALAAEKWTRKQEFGGWTSLDYERAIFLRGPAGFCFAMTITPTTPEAYIPAPQEISEA